MGSSSTQDVLEGLEPAAVWTHFGAIAAIPRASGNEQGVRDYLARYAEMRNLAFKTDAIGNVVIRIPGRGRGVQSAAVIIQGHMDMVCEKNAAVTHDFDRDPIALVRDGDTITADGTTLGADNGIGVALGLAAGDGLFADHPPLELLLTMDEETGMTGARELDTSMLSADRMINLDAEEEGTLYVGCAGGQDTLVSATAARAPVEAGTVARTIDVRGLKGGHSGLDIHRNRGNAVRLLAHTLRLIENAGHDVRVVALDGGSKRNAIPREARAVIRIAETDASAIEDTLRAAMPRIMSLHVDSEPGYEIAMVPCDDSRGAYPKAFMTSLLRYLYAVPSGVIAMSQAVPGLVETSSNLGVLETDGDRVTVTSCSRSSNMAALEMVAGQIRSLAEACGLDVSEEGDYPGWQPNMQSKLLDVSRSVFKELGGGVVPEVTAIHAGLECGLLGDRIPGLDMISFGPDIRGAHSPDELVAIPSVAAVARQLDALLSSLCT